MKIAYVCTDPGIPIFGAKGSSVHVQEMLHALRRQGADIDIFGARFAEEHTPAYEQGKVHKLPPLPKVKVAEREQAALAANADLLESLRRHGPFDLIYERFALWSYAAMKYARDSAIPGFLEVNAPLIEEQATHRVLVDQSMAERAARRAFCGATKLLAVSSEVALWLERYSETAGRVYIVPNGVDVQRFRPDLPTAICRDHELFTVGFVGGLKPWHDLDTLVAAFEELYRLHPNVRLQIIGDGPQREHLRKNLAARNLLHVTRLLGAVPPDEVPAWLLSMDVALALYPKTGNFYFSPLKVYEYLATGLPVVATEIGQLADLLTHGVNGFLCPPGDVAAVTRILDVLYQDPLLRVRVGRSGRECACRHHTWDAVAKQVLQLAAPRPVPRKLAAGG